MQRGLEEASDRVYYLYQAMMDAEGIVAAASETDRQPVSAQRRRAQPSFVDLVLGPVDAPSRQARFDFDVPLLWSHYGSPPTKLF